MVSEQHSQDSPSLFSSFSEREQLIYQLGYLDALQNLERSASGLERRLRSSIFSRGGNVPTTGTPKRT